MAHNIYNIAAAVITLGISATATADDLTKEITVETTLKHPSDGSDIRDQSNLKDIRNTRGDEEYTQGSDGSLIWENHGADISYKGTSDAEPPVRVKVTYYLNGEQISPKKLAGKSRA